MIHIQKKINTYIHYTNTLLRYDCISCGKAIASKHEHHLPPFLLVSRLFFLLCSFAFHVFQSSKKIVWSFSSRLKFSSGRRWQSNDWGAPWHILSRFWLTTRAPPLAGHSRGLFGHYPLIWPQAEPPLPLLPSSGQKSLYFWRAKSSGQALKAAVTE